MKISIYNLRKCTTSSDQLCEGGLGTDEQSWADWVGRSNSTGQQRCGMGIKCRAIFTMFYLRILSADTKLLHNDKLKTQQLL